MSKVAFLFLTLAFGTALPAMAAPLPAIGDFAQATPGSLVQKVWCDHGYDYRTGAHRYYGTTCQMRRYQRFRNWYRQERRPRRPYPSYDRRRYRG